MHHRSYVPLLMRTKALTRDLNNLPLGYMCMANCYKCKITGYNLCCRGSYSGNILDNCREWPLHQTMHIAPNLFIFEMGSVAPGDAHSLRSKFITMS
jgi:hypothetical protein